MVTPVFIFSLPRSGSTLLQRMISSHPSVATASEPTFLVPLLCTLRDDIVKAEYGHQVTRRAFDDFLATMPNGRTTYLDELRTLAMNLYSESGQGAPYFVDKSGLYYLIAEELHDMFGDDARYIVLWRNPLAAAASINRSFADDTWILPDFEFYFDDGIPAMAEFSTRHDDVKTIRYEDLIADPMLELDKLFDYIGLEMVGDPTRDFADVELAGFYGDKWGTVDYQAVSEAPLDKWTDGFDNRFRRRWAVEQLERIGADRLAVMGYDQGAILEQLSSSAPSGVGIRDALWHLRYRIYAPIHANLIKEGLAKARQGRRVNRLR